MDLLYMLKYLQKHMTLWSGLFFGIVLSSWGFAQSSSIFCNVPYDLTTAVFAGTIESYDVSSEETYPKGLAFNNDGTKMFIVGSAMDTVEEYNLPTAYDVSTAIYTGASVGLFVRSHESEPTDLTFNNDGTKLYVVGSNGDAVVTYNLSPGFDLSSATYAGLSQEFDVSGEDVSPQGITFNNTGTKMFIMGSTGDTVVEYNLSIAFDVSTAMHTGLTRELDVSAQDNAPRDLAFSSDGTQLIVVGTQNNALYTYDLSIPFDISTALYGGVIKDLSVELEENDPEEVIFNSSGTKMYVLGITGDTILEYNLTPPLSDYREEISNSGSLATNTLPVRYTLQNDTFVDTDNNDLLDGGISINNLPGGLTPIWTLSGGDTVATLSFEGTATNHNGADDVAALDITITAAATTGGTTNFDCNFSTPGIQFQNARLAYVALNPNSLRNTTEINNLLSGLGLSYQDRFARGIAPLGDLNADGIPDLAVGAYYDDNGGNNSGAAYILFMDTDGSVGSFVKIDNSTTNGPPFSPIHRFGTSVAAGDLNGDNIPDLVVGADGNDTGGTDRGAVHILYLNRDGSVQRSIEINQNTPGMLPMSNNDRFGNSVAVIQDLNGDSVPELVVGTPAEDAAGSNSGGIHLLYMNLNGTIQSAVRIDGTTLNGPSLSSDDRFGTSVADIGDVNGDGIPELAVGAINDDTAPDSNQGAVHILFMNANGTVQNTTEINTTASGLALNTNDSFGSSIAPLGDLNGDGIPEIAVGSYLGDSSRGEIHLIYLRTDGSPQQIVPINRNTPNGPSLGSGDNFGISLGFLGDLNGDHIPEIAVGAHKDDAGGSDRGAIHILSFDFLYPEVLANDGNIDNTHSLSIHLSGDTFNAADNTTLTIGTDVIIGNVPLGLFPILTVGNNQTVATLTFIGQAIRHFDLYDVSNLTFEFKDSAFTSFSATDIENSGASTPYSTHIGIDFQDNANSEYNLIRHGQYFSNGIRTPINF
ncbi:MAG: FG-GAP-like repeat-containing protein [Flavobacteriaceae bacterium]